MKKFILLLFLFSSYKGFTQIDSFYFYVTRSVVYLSGGYFKNPTDSLLTHAAGTGFFVLYRDGLYLVTAEHVAKKLQYLQQVTFNDSANTPRTLSLTDIQKTSVIHWTYPCKEDLAVNDNHT